MINCPKCVVAVTRVGDVLHCPICKRNWRDKNRNNQSDTVKVVQGELDMNKIAEEGEKGGLDGD